MNSSPKSQLDIGVEAATPIGEDVRVGPLTGAFAFAESLRDERQVARMLRVSASGDTILDGDGGTGWVSRLQGARDCSEQNVEVAFDAESRRYFVRTVREIQAGEQLLVWFAESCSLRLGVPVLSVLNIRAHHCYQCHVCQREFLHPNVLKAHLMHACKPTLPLPFVNFPLLPRPAIFDFAAQHRLLGLLALHKGRAFLPQGPHRRPWEEPAAAHLQQQQQQQPQQQQQQQQHEEQAAREASSRKLQSSFDSVDGPPSDSTPDSSPRKPEQLSPSAAPPILLPSDAEPLDLIPRSLYTCKASKGHLCIYCGKVYSRKYGLKIHLRTHTGYKPLKCRVCLRPFGDPSNLNKHIRLHAEGDTPYRCEHCGKVLVRRRDLERHQRSRHPDKVCDAFADN